MAVEQMDADVVAAELETAEAELAAAADDASRLAAASAVERLSGRWRELGASRVRIGLSASTGDRKTAVEREG